MKFGFLEFIIIKKMILEGKMDKNTEYTMLKEEILNLTNTRNNYIIALYTITVTIIVFAIERQNQYIFLIAYIILFAFQRRIISSREGMVRIAAYIVVFLEEGTGWESNYNEIFRNTCIKSKHQVKNPKLFELLTGRVSVVQLGFFCSAASIVMNWYNNKITLKNIIHLELIDYIAFICAVILYILLRIWSKNALKTNDIRNDYINELKQYKEKLKKEQLK